MSFKDYFEDCGVEGAAVFVHQAVEEQMAAWDSRYIAHSDFMEKLGRYHYDNVQVYVYLIASGKVNLIDKDRDILLRYPPSIINIFRERALVWRDFLQEAVDLYKIDSDLYLAIDTGDLANDSTDFPVFSFQKKKGYSLILLPDMQIIEANFQPPEACAKIPYQQKLNCAEFYGSTTGKQPIRMSDVKDTPFQRLDAFLFFQKSTFVKFELLDVVQCENAEVESALRQLGVGGPRKSLADSFGCKFAISIDGNGAPCIRPFHALHSTSALLKYDSDFVLFYSGQLTAGRHYIPVSKNSDVLEVVEREIIDPGCYEPIASQGAQFARDYLRKSVALQYVSSLLERYIKKFGLTKMTPGERSMTLQKKYPDTLDTIGVRYGTDKSSLDHDYLSFYEERLAGYRNEKFLFIEIGIFKGGSLKTWSEYFPMAEIIGVDIDSDTSAYGGNNRSVYIADASQESTRDLIIANHGKPLIVLDDGSHIWQQQIDTLKHFWPHILPGGAFIMEDIHTSMPAQAQAFPWYSGGSPFTAYDYIANLNRFMVGEGSMGDEKPIDQFIAEAWSTVRSIEWYRRTCIIRKKL